MNVPEIWSSVPNRKFFQKKFGSLYIVNGAVKLVHNVLALGAVADFGAQNCQYTTKVDAR